MSAQDDLVKQILGQNLTGKWSGEGHGSSEANAKDMASKMASAGITDIKQFGKVAKYDPVQEAYKSYNGYRVTKTLPDENGQGGGDYVYTKPTNRTDNEGGVIYETLMVPKGEKLESNYGFYRDLGEAGHDYIPVDSSKVVDRNGVLFAPTGTTTFGNKETGQEIPTHYSKASGNIWSGTFAGKGSTAYGVHFNDDGTPVFYTQYGGSSNDLANFITDMGPMFQIGMAIATGGLSIPQQIAANLAVSALSGQDMAEAIKNAAISLAVAQIPGTDFMKEVGLEIKNLGLDPAIANTLNNAAQNAAMSATRAVLTGQDVFDAALKGAAAGGVNGAVGEIVKGIPDFDKLTPTQQKMAANAVTGVISGKPMDQILINSAIAAANAEIAEQKKYAPLSDDDLSYLTPEQRKVYDETGSKGLLEYNRAQKAANTTQNADVDALTKSGLTSTDMGPKGPDGYTDAERESKRIQDFIAAGGDPNAIDTVTIKEPQPRPGEHVFDPTYGGILKPTVPDPNEILITDKRSDRDFDFSNKPTTTPVNLDLPPSAPPAAPPAKPPAPPPAGPTTAGPSVSIDPVKALETLYNPFAPAPKSTPSQTDTGPIQLMTDVFGTNIATAQKAAARGYGFSAGGDIDELLRLLRR